MGLADLLLRKHTAIAKVVIPSSMAFGFFYTLNHGTNALTDAKSAALGTPRVLAVSLVASPQVYKWTTLQLSFCMQLYRYSKRSCSIFFQAKLYWCRQQQQPVIQFKALLHQLLRVPSVLKVLETLVDGQSAAKFWSMTSTIISVGISFCTSKQLFPTLVLQVRFQTVVDARPLYCTTVLCDDADSSLEL